MPDRKLQAKRMLSYGGSRNFSDRLSPPNLGAESCSQKQDVFKFCQLKSAAHSLSIHETGAKTWPASRKERFDPRRALLRKQMAK
jgi:hypothetical protein